ncbi:MAG: histidine phosphatase family protein [Spirochaetota bacterium]
MRVPDFHTLPHECEFYFVRHGESESNAEGRIQGHNDSPLSELGRSHAQAAARWLGSREIDAVLSSPLSRASETADVIARGVGVSAVEKMAELIELDTGRFSGKRLRDVATEDEELFRRFRVDSWEAVPDAERIESLQRRARSVWKRLLELAHRGHRRIVCVTHGGMVQWLIKATVGADEQRWMPLFETSNCGVFLFAAQSTMPDPDTGDDPPDPGTGYYGNWKLINFVPYES